MKMKLQVEELWFNKGKPSKRSSSSQRKLFQTKLRLGLWSSFWGSAHLSSTARSRANSLSTWSQR